VTAGSGSVVAEPLRRGRRRQRLWRALAAGQHLAGKLYIDYLIDDTHLGRLFARTTRPEPATRS
jgi:hypothetical protein